MVTIDKSFDGEAAPSRRVVFAPPRPVRTARYPSQRPLVTPPAIRSTEQTSAAAATPVVSPTTSIDRVLQVFALGLVLAVIFGARGLVHSGKGMDLGVKRTVTLSIGEPVLAVTDFLHLTLPWDVAEGALGRGPLPSTAPLAASSTSQSGRGSGTENRAPSGGDHHVLGPTKAVKPKLVVVHPRTPTRANPLRLLVTGDSLTEYIAPQLVDLASQAGPVRGFPDTHYGTGLVRPDFVDWSVLTRQQVAAIHPDAVVVYMGGNDFQNIQLPDGRILQAASPDWTKEYERRAAVCMRIWTHGGTSLVYWLSLPPARDSAWSHANAQIDVALRRAAAQVPGARYLDVLGPVTRHGQYADFVYNSQGQPVLVREPDGIHFNSTGSEIVAHEVLTVLKKDWHLGRKGQ